MKRITDILKPYISERIPQKATNIFFQMFNGIQAMFESLEYRLDIFKRERNILTAQNLSSLRNLAAQNGYEPKLRVSSKGILMIRISPKLFNRVGYPLFIKPYSYFTNKISKLNYYYISDKTIRIDTNTIYVPVIEGLIQTTTFVASNELIQRFYIQEEKVAEDSIVVEVEGTQFVNVKSFYDNEGFNDNKQFMVKFSNDSQNPIIVYVKGLKQNDSVNITYRLTNGELGNLTRQQEFETESLVDSLGSSVIPSDDEIKIINISGFNFGSNGTDENALRGAIGYNHGIELLFDNTSYRNFLSKFSNILVQDIKIDNVSKQINNIYIWRKQYLNPTNNTRDIIKQYQDIITYNKYTLSDSEKIELDKLLSEYEYCLSSHNLYKAKTVKYALQIMFNNQDELNKYKDEVEQLIYFEFSKFLYIRNHFINLESLFDDFREKYNIRIEYVLFNEHNEKLKFETKNEDLLYSNTNYIIYHTVNGDRDYYLKSEFNNKNYQQNIEGPFLPILKGDFEIADEDFTPVKLFSDIHFTLITNN